MRAKAILLAGAIGATLALTGAASAGQQPAVKIRLAMIPLPKSALGSVGKSLALAFTSGSTPSAKGLGDLGGYGLDYGFLFRGGAGVTEIATSVERYTTSKSAERALARARKQDAQVPDLPAAAGITSTVQSRNLPAIGNRRFAYLTTLALANAASVYSVEEQFTDGAYVLGVTVSAGTEDDALNLAPQLALILDTRLRLALAGLLRGKPVKLLSPPAVGPPSHGPDLATLLLTSDDLGQATVQDQGYQFPDAAASSTYSIDWEPAGSWTDLGQFVEWYANANEATWSSALGVGDIVELASGLQESAQTTPVDLTSIGDNARGAIVQVSPKIGPSQWFVVLGLARGRADDIVFASSDSLVQASDLLSLAQATANRLDAGLAG